MSSGESEGPSAVCKAAKKGEKAKHCKAAKPPQRHGLKAEAIWALRGGGERSPRGHLGNTRALLTRSLLRLVRAWMSASFWLFCSENVEFMRDELSLAQSRLRT